MLSSVANYSILKNHNISPSRNFSASLQGFGDNLFRGAIAAPYLEKQGLPADTLDKGTWAVDGNAEKVSSSYVMVCVDQR